MTGRTNDEQRALGDGMRIWIGIHIKCERRMNNHGGEATFSSLSLILASNQSRQACTSN